MRDNWEQFQNDCWRKQEQSNLDHIQVEGSWIWANETGLEINISYVKRSELPDFVFGDAGRPPPKKNMTKRERQATAAAAKALAGAASKAAAAKTEEMKAQKEAKITVSNGDGPASDDGEGDASTKAGNKRDAPDDADILETEAKRAKKNVVIASTGLGFDDEEVSHVSVLIK